MDSSFPPFEKNETRIYVLVSGLDFSKSKRINVTNFKDLWKQYWKILSTDFYYSKKAPVVEDHEEDYRKALTKIFRGDDHPPVYPISYNNHTSLLFKALGLGSTKKSSLEKSSDSSSSDDSSSSEDQKPKKKVVKRSSDENRGKLPIVNLVHFPQRQGWPFALLGETKSLKDVLKFTDVEDKISCFVTNVNKEFGAGWNLKKKAVKLIREMDGEKLKLQEFEDVREYRGYNQD